jgi:hypothetical protein
MKRIILIFAMLALGCMLMFAGCAKKAPEPGGNTGNVSTPQANQSANTTLTQQELDELRNGIQGIEIEGPGGLAQ